MLAAALGRAVWHGMPQHSLSMTEAAGPLVRATFGAFERDTHEQPPEGDDDYYIWWLLDDDGFYKTTVRPTSSSRLLAARRTCCWGGVGAYLVGNGDHDTPEIHFGEVTDGEGPVFLRSDWKPEAAAAAAAAPGARPDTWAPFFPSHQPQKNMWYNVRVILVVCSVLCLFTVFVLVREFFGLFNRIMTVSSSGGPFGGHFHDDLGQLWLR